MMTTSDGLKLHVQEWPVPNAKATVVLVHGFAEHIGRYAHVVEALNTAGYRIVGYDHRLHGKSEGTPRAYVTDVDVLVKDLKQVWDGAKTDSPMFMLGHSMGGLIAACFALRHQDEMQGLVTSGAALLSRHSVPSLLLSAVQFIARFAPRTPILKLNSSLLSHDPRIVTAYDSDPLVNREPTRAATLTAFAKAGGEAVELAPGLKIPLLMLHGEQDKIVPPKATQSFFERAGSADKTLKLYPGLYHEIFNEPEKNEILQTVAAWLDAHLFATAAK